MSGSWIAGDTAARYLAFAEGAVAGVSPSYERICRWVAGSEALIAFLEALPEPKRQPNLFLAALRVVAGVPEDAAALHRAVAERGPEIAAQMRGRATQTNEPGRCATLLPAFARFGERIALLEVGASAGLCLLPDRYGYDYGAHRIAAPAAEAPVFPCRVTGPAPLPARVPEIVWRAGLDLAPKDVRSAEDMAWLEALVWPEQTDRLARLQAAIRVARKDPPPLRTGDLARDLAAAVAEAPPDVPLVVFHTAVLAYVPPEERARFAAELRGLGAHWVCNEAPGVVPAHAAGLAAGPEGDRFVLAIDGRGVAWTHPHGAWLHWIG